jgi:molybdopterin/thiamine biosynthesis adenylyltransferase
VTVPQLERVSRTGDRRGGRAQEASGVLEVLVGGVGAIGSRLADVCADRDLAFTFLDAQVVEPENLTVAAFAATDLLRPKAEVAAERRRALGPARALTGDLRYTLRPGLARALDAAVLCLDNAAALRDAAEAIWSAGAEIPVLVLTCGGETEPGWLVRLFVPPGPCPACLFGAAERRADHAALAGASCARTTAPRAAARAAEAAARAGTAILARWRAGDRSLAHHRVQADAPGGRELVVSMPEGVSPRCPVVHGSDGHVEDLGGTVAHVSVGDLAERAMARVGDDAEVVLGRRSVPLGGLWCPGCGRTWGTPPLLLPAARRAPRPCACAEPPRPIADRHSVGMRELLGLDGGRMSLAAWGAGHGDEFAVAGARGHLRLRCRFDWSELA